MPTKTMTRSSSTSTATRSKAQIVGQTTGTSTGAKAGSSSGRPLVLKKRDANRQARLTSSMQSSRSRPAGAGTPASARASSSKTVMQSSNSNEVSGNSASIGRNSSVIVISSDDEDNDILLHPSFRPISPKGINASAGGKRKERESGNGMGPDDIIVARLKREIEELKKQREQFEKDIHREKHTAIRLRVERETLRHRLNEAEEKVKQKEKEKPVSVPARVSASVNLNEIDDLVSCEICTTKMFHPATLRECGHTFCESCLHDWFNSTYTQHVATHPEFLEGPQIPVDYLRYQHLPQFAEGIRRFHAEWKKHVAQPMYTCPTCRTQVKTKPIEVFFVKDVVRKVAQAMDGKMDGGRSPKRLNRGAGSIWDGFFPEK